MKHTSKERIWEFENGLVCQTWKCSRKKYSEKKKKKRNIFPSSTKEKYLNGSINIIPTEQNPYCTILGIDFFNKIKN